ncbi:hypothetical protein [Flavobacterium pallidum]|uniref:Uncharacterized protein n=1 Tax=Flavobacterium pallidum TaxID=2172098 RepID=A0A2S1SKX8_9FLAO|nr:hypothetical protein [Flavobacterium pallidum]AWI27063.1 hypothetical protein HYN49_14770 [Flavobacterium pallidum]
MEFEYPRISTLQDLYRMLNVPVTIDLGARRYPPVESIDCYITGGEMASARAMESLTVETTTGETRIIKTSKIKAIRRRNM